MSLQCVSSELKFFSEITKNYILILQMEDMCSLATVDMKSLKWNQLLHQAFKVLRTRTHTHHSKVEGVKEQGGLRNN